MTAQLDAVAKLLRDDDPDTVRLVKAQLVLGGQDSLAGLEDLAGRDDERVAHHARAVLAEIVSNDADDDFLLLCHFFHEGTDLEGACWMLARALNPALETRAFEHKVNQWGRQFLVRISGVVSNRERVICLADYLAGELCFRGNTDDYYCERNSLLTSVIETRMGTPITLTMIYRMVAERAGMKVEGINLPGHFVARHGEVLFDPFHRGRILTKGDCEDILRRQNMKLRPAHLDGTRPRHILLRILANLLYVFDLRKDTVRHARVNAWVKALSRDLCNSRS
jgi:regulator of sirC expression with transglutaminase-like and TPR domain